MANSFQTKVALYFTVLASILSCDSLTWAQPPQPNVTPAQMEQLNQAYDLNEEAVKLYRQGKAREALPLTKRALETRRSILGDFHATTASSLNNMGELSRTIGDYAAARMYFEQALRSFKQILGADHPNNATLANNIGLLLQDQADYSNALPYFQQGLAIRRKAFGNDHADTILSLQSLATLHRTMGDYALARQYYEQALASCIRVLGENHRQTAIAYLGLGSLFFSQGNYAAAKTNLEQALKIRKTTLGDEHPETASALSVLGNLSNSQRDFDTAQNYHEQTLAIRRKVLGDEHRDTAQSMNNLGNVLANKGDYSGARSLYEKSLAIRKKLLGDSHPDTNLSLNNIGFLLENQGDFSAARPFYEQALAGRKNAFGSDHPETTQSLDNLFVLDVKTGNLVNATKTMDESLRGTGRHVARVLPSLSVKEQLLFLARNSQGSLHLGLSFALRERANSNIANTSASWVINGKGASQEALAKRTLLTRDVANPETSAAIQQLIELRRQLANLALSEVKPQHQQQRRATMELLTAQEAALTREVAQKTARPEWNADPWVELDTVRKAIPNDAILIEFAKFDHFNYEAKEANKKWEPARYAAWLIPPRGKGDVEIVEIGSAKEIDAAVATAVQTIADAAKPNGSIITSGPAEADKLATAALAPVRDLVWKPIAGKITDGTKRLILSPDGNLWLLPWAALPLKDGSAKLLLEDYVTQLEISGRDLTRTFATSGNPNPPVIFADPDYDLSADATKQSIQAIFPGLNLNADNPHGAFSQTAIAKVPRLPNTAAEADAVAPNMELIAALAPQKYLGQWALETVVKRVSRPKMLMLSTHGFFLSNQETKRTEQLEPGTAETRSAALLTVDGKPLENPLLRCGLMFAGCNAQQFVGSDEGVLTGLEVLDLDLRGTELVVLSACETATGQVRNGQGVSGLRQAFQLSGAQAVVATLWQVPDKDSALIVNDFFRNLAAGQSRPEALRNAQLQRIEKLRERDSAAHPFFWAAWTITGR